MRNLNAETSKTSQPILLCGHPLSEKFRRAVEAQIARPATYVSLSGLKSNGVMPALLHLFRQRTESVFIVFEEPEEIIFLPVICIASLAIRANQRFVIDPDQQLSRLSGFDVAKAIASLAIGSMGAAKSGLLALFQLAAMRESRNPAAVVNRNSRIIYLNTNVMFGVKAGGSLGHIAGVVNDLYRRNIDILYVATRRSSVIDSSVPMQQLRIPAALGFPNELFLFGLSQQAYRQLRGLFDAAHPDLIYQRMSRCNYAGAMFSQKHNVPLVIEYNGSEAWGARHWGHPMIFERLARKAELVSLKSAQLVVTISDVLAQELSDMGIERSRIVVYPNCVDSSVFDSSRFDTAELEALRARHGIPANATVFGFIGTFGTWHGINILCESIKRQVRESVAWLDKMQIRFLIVGDGHFRASVEELVRDEAVRKYVSWPGLVEQADAPAYLAAMDILVSPHVRNPDGSRFFGSPTKLFEYMSMSRPIIASRLEQIEQVLSPCLSAACLPKGGPGNDASELAVLTEPGDAGELVEAMRFIVERPDWRSVLARNARREVLEKYQWSHHVERIMGGLRGLADSAGSRAS